MGLRKSSKAREIEQLMAGGMKASEVISSRPDLVEGFNDLVKVKAPRTSRPRGSGSIDYGPDFVSEGDSLELPTP